MNKSDLISSFGWIYGAIGAVRRELYDKGVFESSDLGVPVISVGNITAGGTGKTPLVAFIAQVLAANGEKVCILTRGYKRADERERVLVSDGENILADAGQSGDEPLELARKLLGKAAVVADANRVAAGKWARGKLGVTVFLLDDGFQHLKVKRDLDIVCIDATNPFGNKNAGILREPLRNLKLADAIVITRANLIEKKELAELKTDIFQLDPDAKIFVSENKVAGLTAVNEFLLNLKSQSIFAENSRLSAYFAFCGLGNPENFFEQLRRDKLDIVCTQMFSDHHFYTQQDVDNLVNTATQKGATCLLTTAKDAVKLAGLIINLPCLVAENELIFDDEKGLKKLIGETGLKRASPILNKSD